MAGQLSAVGTEALEREYVALRRSVMAMLRGDFAGVPDHEELYQEAWAEALELQARGEEIANLGGLVRTIAWRRARDRLRKHKPQTVDPDSLVIQGQADPGELPEDQVAVRLEAALIRQVVDSLDKREAAVIKLRFDRHLDSREIQAELGVSAKRLEKIVTAAYKNVEAALAEPAEGLSEWRRRQRSLLLACESGLASAHQRRQARGMLRDDPVCRAMLAEIRSTLEGVAALLPFPLVVERASSSRLTQMRLDLVDRLGAARDQLADLAGRVSGHGASFEQAGAGGAASIGGGLAVKAALTCVAITGTTVVCLTTGIIDAPKPARAKAEHLPRKKRVVKPAATTQPIAVARVTPPVTAPKPASSKTSHTAVVRAAPVAAPPPPSPAPAASTEFGPGAVGSSSASSTPAAAPSGGGGEFQP